MREHKHDLNDEADRLANNFNKRPPAGFNQKKMPSCISNYAVQLMHDGSTITKRLYQIMSQQLHRAALKDYIKKRSGWTEGVFSQVD